MTEIKLNGRGSINRVNGDKQGPKSDRVVAIHAAIDLIVDQDVLGPLLGTETNAETIDAFFDADGVPRFLAIDTIKLHRDIKFTGCRFHIGSNGPYRNATIHKISTKPISDNRVVVSFTLSVEHPPSGLFALLAEMIDEEDLSILVETEQQDLPLSEEAA